LFKPKGFAFYKLLGGHKGRNIAATHKKFALVAFGRLQNVIDPAPCLRMLLESCHEGINLLSLVVVPACVHCHDDLHTPKQHLSAPFAVEALLLHIAQEHRLDFGF
jgi:hypothetical protein